MALSLVSKTNLKSVANILRLGIRSYCDVRDREKPVKFSTSEAAGWRAAFTRSGNIYDDSPDSQPVIISISTGIFLFYFLYYREENDIDERLYVLENIYGKVEGLEEVQLKMYREAELKKGLDVTEIDERLKIVINERLAKESKSSIN